MILGNVRASLTRNDAQLALRLICRGSATELESAEEARGSTLCSMTRASSPRSWNRDSG